MIVPTLIQIDFDDARLEGWGRIETENGSLYADGHLTVERADLVYLDLVEGKLVYRETDQEETLEPGDYLVCRGGLYLRLNHDALAS